MTRKKSYPEPHSEAWLARTARWRHNGLLGGAAMAKSNMGSILSAHTVTLEAKATAADIQKLLVKLIDQLKIRNPGT